MYTTFNKFLEAEKFGNFRGSNEKFQGVMIDLGNQENSSRRIPLTDFIYYRRC